MSAPIRLLLALDGDTDVQDIRSVLPPEAGVEIVGVSEGQHRSWGSGAPPTADMVVVACSGFSDAGLGLVDGSVTEAPDRPVVVLCTSPPNGFLRRAFEAGADDVLVLPETAEKVLFALEKTAARTSGARSVGRVTLAPMICVLGPKGGTGKTLTSVNLAVSMARAGMRPAVVDLDLQFGDVGLSLGVSPERTVYDLATSGGGLDAEKVGDYLVDHDTGVRALLAPIRPDQASVVTIEFLRDVWRMLRSDYDCLIVDTPPDFTPEVIAAIDASSDVCVVGMLDSLSIKNTKLGLETLQLMGYDPERIRVVLNRADTHVGISQADVVRVLGREPDVFVPSDRDIPLSVNEGAPIVGKKPRSEAARSFASLARMYGAAAPAEQGRRMFRRSAAAPERKRRRLLRRKDS